MRLKLIIRSIGISLILILSGFTLILAQKRENKIDVVGANSKSISKKHLEILKEYLKVFDEGNVKGLKKFAAAYLSDQERHGATPEKIAQLEIGFRHMIGGGFELYQVEKNTNTELVATLKSAGEISSFARMQWEFEAIDSRLIIARRLRHIETPASALPPKIFANQLAKDLNTKLIKLASEDKFSGTVLIAKNSQILWQKAYGYADREAKTSNNLETRFRIGSMNKMFTSVAIAQLVQDGKLKFTDTIAKVLPEYPNKEIAQKVTVHQLLTHTSGLGDIFTPEFEKKKDSLYEIKDYLSLFVDQPLMFEPGNKWEYSNAGFIVLGLIIEKVSGQNYYDYIQRHIYDVAGMKNSGSLPKNQRIPNFAVGYIRQESSNQLTPNWDTLPWRGTSAGGGDSTLGDLLLFEQALQSHKLLNAELTQTIITGKKRTDSDSKDMYAYGFEDRYVAGHHLIGHSGGAPGMNGELDIDIDKGGYTVIVLSNLDPPIAQTVASYISERLQ